MIKTGQAARFMGSSSKMTKRHALIAARKAAGFTQEALAIRVGVERSTVFRWESGETTPLPWLRPGLAGLLRLNDDELANALGERVVRTAIDLKQADSVVTVTRAATGDDLFRVLDDARLLTDEALSASSVSESLVEVIEQRVADYVVAYPTTPPLMVLGAISTDIVEVQGLARRREPAAIQARLSGVTAVLSLLSADALMKLGDVSRARYWYGTARLAADDTLNPELRARVRAQEAMLPYYYGHVQQTVTLARAAQSFVPDMPCSAGALAAAAEARALARLGHYDDAERAMNRSRRMVDELGDTPSDAAFEFNEKRLLLYLSGTLIYMGEYERAHRVQDEALELYRHDSSVVIDPALIALDQAVGHVASGHAQDGCQLATATLRRLPAEHRTKIVLARAADVIETIPAAPRQLPAATELHELIAEQTGTP